MLQDPCEARPHARALVSDPCLLIFDEATSALDYESEAVTQHNLAQICQGRTVFIIAHRLSTVRLAHVIVVLDKGVIVEHGTHEELLARRGITPGSITIRTVWDGRAYARHIPMASKTQKERTMLHTQLAPMPKGKTLEFLPAVLEIQESPPSPIGRTVIWTMAPAMRWITS